MHTHNDTVTVTVTLECWTKAQGMIQLLYDCIVVNNVPLDHRQLESYRGSLVYLSCTYLSLVFHLKRIHLILDSWHPADGWKTCNKDLQVEFEQDVSFSGSGTPPAIVEPAPQLQSDILALQQLFGPAIPLLRPVHPASTATAIYGFGDASGSGFGTTLLINGTIHYRHGHRSTTNQEALSNYWELHNLVQGIKEANHHKILVNCEVFLFTDNTTAEAAFHKGTSSSKTLFDLILHLRCLKVHDGLYLDVIHVAGVRMQQQGTDDLSQGQLPAGVLGGCNILSYTPLHLICSGSATRLETMGFLLAQSNKYGHVVYSV